MTTTTESTDTKITVALNAQQIASIASVAVAAIKGPGYPSDGIITGVNVAIIDGMLHAVATDRYRVARVTFPVFTDPNADTRAPGDAAPLQLAPVTLPRGPLEAFAKTAKTAAGKLAYKHITFEVIAQGDGAPIVTLQDAYSGSGTTLAGMVGNYPPVARLFPTPDQFSEEEELSLKIKYLTDAAKLTHPANTFGAEDPMRFQFTRGFASTKPGPVLLSRKIDAGEGSLEYIVQPNLLLR